MALPSRLTLAGLLLGVLLFIAPSKSNKCSSGCRGIHRSQSYEEGHTYTYHLEGGSVTSVSETQGEATLKLSAVVELAVQPDCVNQIRLKNVQINGAPVSPGELEAHALQFNYHNGHIDTEVCAESGDTQAALNIKRAIISLFQDAIVQDAGSTTHHETDVFGGCPTDFTFSTSEDVRTIKKQRNLDQCSYRENIKQDLITATLNPNSKVKSAPFLTAEQQVEQQFNNGVLIKASSIETYKFKPFSNGNASAKTVVETTLTLKGKNQESHFAPVSEPKSLIFEAPHPVVKSSLDAIVKALHAAKESMPDAVSSSAARRFAELIKVLRQSSKDDILTVYERAKAGAGFEKESAKKVLLDALFRTGTGEAVEAAVELVKSKQLSQLETIIYYTSLVFIRHVSISSVTTITSLLDNPEIPRIAYLGIGSLIGKYCAEHNCENVLEVNAALDKMSSKLTTATTRKQEDVVISTLKGLGNARYLNDAILLKIAKIAVDKKIHNRVRIAALEALPAKCSMNWKDVVFSTLADRDEDSEIRIKTYLSLVTCPCAHVANKVKEVLDKESVNQVGSFIASHLRNLRASTSAEKLEVKRHLGLIKPRTSFPEDFRKFSFNNELSYSIDAFGIGSSAESNVIYSQNSFVPRSASLNLTIEIFGRFFNFLEIDGRVENLDRLIEQYFGPKGVLRPSNLKDVVLDGRKTFDDISAKIANRFHQKVGRHARHVTQNDIKTFIEKVELPNTELDGNLELDLSIKLFGAELAFLSYQGGKDQLSTASLVDQILNILENGVDKAKHFNYHLKHHLHFLDAELVYPTGLGFPLTLGVTGTSAVHLKTSGKIDLVAIYKNPQSTAIQIALEPSVSIRIAGSLIIEGYGIESGLKVITTLHSATGTDVSVKLLEGSGVDINVGIPKQKQELITVTSEVLISSGAKGDNYVAPKFSKGKDHSDCFDQLSEFIGLTVCGKISYPYDSIAAVQKKPIFPLSGPASFAFYIENNDVKSYHFKAYYNVANPKARSIEVLLETPNSRTNRRISLLIEASTEPDKVIKVSFDSPFKTASAEAVMKNNDREKTLTVSVHHDSIEYFVRAGIASSGNKYRPILEYKVPDHVEKLAGIKNSVKNSQRNGQQYIAGGVIEVSNYKDGKRYVLDKVVLSSAGQNLISVDGNFALSPSDGNAALKIEYGGDTLALKGNSVITDSFNYKIEASVIPSSNKEYGASVLLESTGDKLVGEQKFIVVYGSDLNSQTNRITYFGKHNLKYKSVRDFDTSIERKITYPAFGLIADLEGRLTSKSIGYDLEFKYGRFQLESELSAKTGTEQPDDFDVDFQAKFLANSIEFKTKRAIISAHQNKFTSSLELQPGGKYELEAVVVYDMQLNNINTQLDAVLKGNGKRISLDVGLEADPNKVNSHAVVNIENTKYVDFLVILHQGNNPNGNLKLNLKNYLNVNGQFRYQKGSAGDAQIEINIPKFNRKITGHGEISIVGSKHTSSVELLYDASIDPKKRVKFSSDCDFTSSSFDTKNVLEVLDYKTTVNAKGISQGQKENGHASVDFDITLPNGRYIVGKCTRATTTKDELIDGKIQFELIDHVTKGGKRRKILHKAEIHKLNVNAITYHAKHDLLITNFNEDNVNLLLELKNLPNGPDKKSVEVKFDFLGSKISSPFSIQIAHDYANDGTSGHGKLVSSLGPKLSLQVNGNYVHGNNIDIPTTADTVLEIKLPNEHLKNLKLELSGTVLIPIETSSRFEFTKKLQLTYNTDQTIKLDSHITNVGIPDESNIIEGSGSCTATILSGTPITVGYTYKHNPKNELKESSGSLNLNCGNKQTTIAFDGTYKKDLKVVNFNIKAITPIAKIHNIDFQLLHKASDMDGVIGIPNSAKIDLILIADQVKYTLTSEYEAFPQKFKGHLSFASPEGKTENIIQVERFGDKEFGGDWKWKSPIGSIDVDGRVHVENIDDFSIVVNFDSDKVKNRNIHVDIANKAAKGGKRIQINISSDGKNIITGSTNYNKHSEGGKVIVEGNGSLKIGESTKSSSFKFTRHQLSADVDGESGVGILLNFNFGQSSIVSEFKLTNKEIYILNSYCEQSADCAQIKLQSKTTVADLKRTQETTIEIDLRKFNVPFEFGIKSTGLLDARSGFDNSASIYLHSSKEKMRYGYQIYGHPTESGIVFTLPSRELALILFVDFPKNKHSGAYKIDLSSYLNRKLNPKDKTSLTITGDLAIDKSSASLSGETKLTYPSQPKELSVKGKIHVGGAHLVDANLDIDLFAKRNQKISVVAKLVKAPINTGYNITGAISVVSQGQRLKVDFDQHLTISHNEIGFGSLLSYTDEHQKSKSTGILFSANLQQAHLLIQSPDKALIKADSKIDLTKNLQKIHTNVALLGKEPVVVSLEIKDLNSFKYIYHIKNNANNKLEASGRILVGQSAEIHADIFKDGVKKQLFHLLLYLDERRYLKPDLAFNKDNIAQVINAYRTRIIEFSKLGSEFIDSVTTEIVSELKDLLDHLKKAKPNLKPLVDHYIAELTKLKDELNIETEGITQIQAKLHALFEVPIAAVVETLKKFSERLAEVQKIVLDIVDKLNTALKATLPELKKAWNSIHSAAVEIFEDAFSLAHAYVKTLVGIFNTHKDEFKQIAAIASELYQDIGTIVWRTINKIQIEMNDFFTALAKEIKTLPIYEFVQQKYNEILDYKISEGIIRALNDVVRSVKQFLPTTQLQDLLTVVYDYIIMHVKREKINDVEELKKLYGYTLHAIESIIELVRSHVTTYNFSELLETHIPLDFSALSKLPGIATLKVSALALVYNHEWRTPAEVFYAYRPTLHLSDLIPPFSKFAIFVDGGHFFTFDGRHLTFPGKCNYVLAQDVRDGNFTIVAEFNLGKLMSVTTSARDESITIESSGAVLVNNQAADFPANTNNLHASLRGPVATIVSDYGVKLHCNTKAPLICSIHVSGFYHGRMRGILGNGNNEPWDDFTLPSGKVTENESEFSNAFKLTSGCPNVQTVQHHSSHQHDAVCTEFFTGNSPLSDCFHYVDPRPFREACDHASKSAVKNEGACLIAQSYYAVCRENRVFTEVPAICGSCHVGNQKIDVGDHFSVEHPKHQADIIFVVEQATENAKIVSELITPLITVLRTELKEHGITDVNIGLIGFGDNLEWPQHYTLKGSRNIDGEVKHIKFTDRKPTVTFEDAKTGDLKKKLEFLNHKLEIELGTFKLTDAYTEALAYDFRPGASKTIVGVIATPCEKSPLPISLQQVRLLLGQKAYNDLGLTYHQIATLDDILISGKAIKNVVGFDADSVFTFADSKKKPVEGNTEQKNNMVLQSNDVCATFAATSGGAAFSAHNFLEAKVNQKKQFIQVAGRRLVNSLVNTKINEDCVCRQKFGIHPRTECKIISRTVKEPVIIHTKGLKG